MRFKGTSTLLVCLLLLSSSLLFAQTQITSGSIQGTVSDPTNAVVPGVSVEVKEISTNFTKTQTTDDNGRFVFLLLPPGHYTATVTGKSGFGTLVQENLSLTVGQTISLNLGLKPTSAGEKIVVTETAAVEVERIESSTTLDPTTIATTPVLGRKFEDLLTLTPGVSVVQGPDGNEINFNGQRGIFNNISMDGGDYNNGFFGEQVGGQRAAVDISLEAVQEFQVIASGANAEYGRTGSGIVNVITKSGTNQVHGSGFLYQRLQALTSNTSDGKPLDNFHRSQFGGSIGGPIKKDKMFAFGNFEQLIADLRRDNLSAPMGSCPVATPVVGTDDTIIGSNTECQRLALLNFFKTSVNQDEGQPVDRPERNSAAIGKFDWNVSQKNKMNLGYNFDYSKNTNQTFDVPTYGNSANGIEGASKIQTLNFNLFTTVSDRKLNEAHFTYGRENRPRSAVDSNVPADTAMGFGPTFRFGEPFFLEPSVDEVFWRTQIKDNFSIISGKHTIKMGGEWLHSNNSQVFRGFQNGRYIFDSVDGFLHYASPAAAGGYGPTAAECFNGSGAFTGWVTYGAPYSESCAAGSSFGGPLLLYLQNASTGLTPNLPFGFSAIKNENYAIFAQDTYKVLPNLTVNFGLRWEAQIFPDPAIPPSQTAYAPYLNDPAFPSNGKIPNALDMFQPRFGFAWDVANNQKSVFRFSAGIFNASQNMLTQVGAITTNGTQQQGIAAGTGFNTAGGDPPTWPGPVTIPPLTAPAVGAGVTVFDRNYHNPRIYTLDVQYEQEIAPNWTVYGDFNLSHGVYLTRFVNPNVGSTVVFPTSGDAVSYTGPVPFPLLGDITNTQSSAHSLYRGLTIGMRKRFSHRFQMEANYVFSKDLDDDSNERDPFTFRYFDLYNLRADYSLSDRDERHKFNFYTNVNLPWGFETNVRMQAHSAQPITVSPRYVNGADAGRNGARKDNAYFSFDWTARRPFKFGDRYALIPEVQMFNTFNNKNNVNPLVTPGLFNFDGFLRQGVGDPRQAQLAVKFTF
jgi:Carboxypeptidase regulatory-like domain/TonB dependent receptor